MKSVNKEYLIKDENLEENYNKIFEIDSFYSKTEDQN
jgi:hypothetical protein